MDGKKLCSVSCCYKEVKGRGFCTTHLSRFYRTGGVERIKAENKGFLCRAEKCSEPARKLGYCNPHYLKMKRDGHLIERQPKRAHPHYAIWHERRQCKALAPEWHDDFWRFVKDIGDRPSKNHFLVRPRNEPYGPTNFEWNERLKRRDGETLKEFNARQWQSRRERFPLFEEDRHYRRNYGIDLNRYNEMMVEQDGACAICFKKETALDYKSSSSRRLCVDHCHKTKKVRGLLCRGCNTMIGFIEKHSNDAKIILSLTDYLMKHKEDFKF